MAYKSLPQKKNLCKLFFNLLNKYKVQGMEVRELCRILTSAVTSSDVKPNPSHTLASRLQISAIHQVSDISLP